MSPTTSGSRPCTDCSSGPSRSPSMLCPSTPGAPLFALTSSHASLTSHFEISNGLADDFNWPIELLPDTVRLMRSTQSRTTRPLRSTPVTGASSLLRAGPPACPASVLDPLQCLPLGALPLARRSAGSIGTCLLLFHAEAADRTHVAYMPDTTWPISGHPPGSSRSSGHTPVSMSSVSFSTRQQRFTCVRLPDPHLTPLTTPFPHRSPRQSSANAA